jgi:hypothetical protein
VIGTTGASTELVDQATVPACTPITSQMMPWAVSSSPLARGIAAGFMLDRLDEDAEPTADAIDVGSWPAT